MAVKGKPALGDLVPSIYGLAIDLDPEILCAIALVPTYTENVRISPLGDRGGIPHSGLDEKPDGLI